MNEHENRFAKLITLYIGIEERIIKLVNQNFSSLCKNCVSKCCREEYCRESMDSPFLSLLIKKQKILYDPEMGWLGPVGCKINYGRPLVCHQFFCERFLEQDVLKKSDIPNYIDEFSAIGRKAYGNAHIMCVGNLDKISLKKIEKMETKCNVLISKIEHNSKVSL